jgi:hypothetical protein
MDTTMTPDDANAEVLRILYQLKDRNLPLDPRDDMLFRLGIQLLEVSRENKGMPPVDPGRQPSHITVDEYLNTPMFNKMEYVDGIVIFRT